MFVELSESLKNFLEKNLKVIATTVVSLSGLAILNKILKKNPKNSLGTKKLNIVITGGSHGFGLALIREFLLSGHKVVTCSRSEIKDEKIAKNENLIWLHKFQKKKLKNGQKLTSLHQFI